MTIDLVWVELALRVDETQRKTGAPCATHGKRAIEARPAAGVAASLGASNLDFQPDRILVAVRTQLYDPLSIPADLALSPQAATRARPVMRLARLDGAGKSLFVHIGEHQQLSGLGGGGDHGNKAFRVEFWREDGSFLDVGLAPTG